MLEIIMIICLVQELWIDIHIRDKLQKRTKARNIG